MPFFREIIPDSGIRTGIWRITETAEELLAMVHLNDQELNILGKFSHEMRKKQWLACRALLKHLLDPLDTNLTYDLNGKPHLNTGSHQVSISHAGEFAAVVCSENRAVGVDIEKIKDRIERVKDRFLQEKELKSVAVENRIEQLYIFWGGKEALYKLHGKPDVDFRTDIYIHPFDYLCNTNQYGSASITLNDTRQDYTLFYKKIEDYMMVVAF